MSWLDTQLWFTDSCMRGMFRIDHSMLGRESGKTLHGYIADQLEYNGDSPKIGHDVVLPFGKLT